MSHFTVALKLKDYIRGGLYRSGSLTLNFSVFRHLKRASLLSVYLPWLLLITWLIICKHQSALCTLLNTPFNQPLFIVLSFTLANVTEVFLCFLLLSCFTASSFFISPQFPSRCVGVCVCVRACEPAAVNVYWAHVPIPECISPGPDAQEALTQYKKNPQMIWRASRIMRLRFSKDS